VIGCRLHDMVLDLLRVRSQEENFITISSSNTNIVEGTSSASSRVRRLAHHGKRHHEDSLLGMDVTNVRTFIANSRFHGTIIDDEVQSFQLLRVQHVEDCRAVNLEHVDKLLHLRYLGVNFTSINGELPKGIGNLKFLQTLDIGGVDDYGTELPSSLGLLTQLICLRIGGIMLSNGVIEKLTSLEELQIYCCGHMAGPFVKELGKLHELRVLDCSFEEELDKNMQSDLVESLGNLHKIRHLKLNSGGLDVGGNILQKDTWDLQHLDIDLTLTGLPSCINPINHPNLTHLDNLFVSDLDEHGLKNLGALPELCYLKLRIYNDGIGSSVTITLNDGFFRKL
jgi:Leucine-rich repeat (LRR) protein